MKNNLREAVEILRLHWRTYLTLNVLYYGLIIIGMAVIVFAPGLQQSLLGVVRSGLDKGVLSAVKTAYVDGNVVGAMVLTFVVNLLVGSVLTITVPSMLIPFSGLATGLWRATVWGLVFAPVDPHLRWVMIPHSLTLLLEGQAYVVAMFAAYRLGLGLLRPGRVEAGTAWEGYRRGLRQSRSLYSLVVVLLAVAAAYEALEVIWLAPLLR